VGARAVSLQFKIAPLISQIKFIANRSHDLQNKKRRSIDRR
jgi:hypothetical protein